MKLFADILKSTILTLAFIGFMLAIIPFILSAAVMWGFLAVGDFVMRDQLVKLCTKLPTK